MAGLAPSELLVVELSTRWISNPLTYYRRASFEVDLNLLFAIHILRLQYRTTHNSTAVKMVLMKGLFLAGFTTLATAQSAVLDLIPSNFDK